MSQFIIIINISTHDKIGNIMQAPTPPIAQLVERRTVLRLLDFLLLMLSQKSLGSTWRLKFNSTAGGGL